MATTVGKPAEVDVVVLGAGFSGICAAIQLKRRGRESFVVLEKGPDVGGTWRENAYPGAECDIPSHIYSYSFAPKPDWSKHYAPGPEILDYIRSCARDFDLTSHIRLNTLVTRAVWEHGRWDVSTAEGDVTRARYVISGLGGLHTPSYPALPGRDSFRGRSFHTSTWDHAADLRGRRIGMIGTGATAVQAAPALAEAASDLYVFQRTPTWVGSKRDPLYTPEQKAEFATNPHALRRHRWELWRHWETTGEDLFTAGTRLNQIIEEAALVNILENVEDPELAAKLRPAYNITCKRPTISNRYYPIFNRPHVHLVTDPVARVTPTGLVLRTGEEIPLDVLVYATGFKPFDITTEIEVVGLDRRGLADAWSGGITTYRTVMTHGFPNFFFLLGPNTAGLNSALQMIEAGTKYALNVISRLNGGGAMHPRQAAVEAFAARIAEMSRFTTANKGCTSWWTAGGTNHSLWPASSVTYRLMLSKIDTSDFHLVEA
jgi:cation diffusion facilitator CzcD-associated flavoprotein CzcO